MKSSFLLRWSVRIALVGTLGVAPACLPGIVATIRFPAPPMLVAVAPGVWVVEDSPQAVFYVGDSYWYHERGVWYRSPSYDGHWLRVGERVVPAGIRTIDQRRYRHYHAPAGARVRRAGKARPAEDHDRRGRQDDHHDAGKGQGHDNDHGRAKKRGHDHGDRG